jgi:anti-anti-sigma factor
MEVHDYGSAIVLAVDGEIDSASCPAWELQLRRVADAGRRLVIVDLGGLEFMAACGLGALIEVNRRLRRAGRRLGVVRDGPQVDLLMDITGTATSLTLGDTREALLANL